MVDITLTTRSDLTPSIFPVEIVERKGIGHPDTICDALAETLSLALCRFYRDQFGLILHHNVDKALLVGGESRPAFGGGEILTPMEIFLAGRATSSYKGVSVPIAELVEETSHRWLRDNFHALIPEQHVKIHTLVRKGSVELVDLYERQQLTGVALANDTSCGVGYAPLDELEQLVYAVEQYLNSSEIKTRYPAIGEDIKVMGIRQDDAIMLTIACAFIDRFIKDVDEYLSYKQQVIDLVNNMTSDYTTLPVTVRVNTADALEKESLYLTVTGTSAEAGDDGEVGRGNRANGLITPNRPMNMEAVAGKNPVTHVGKLYNIVAGQICNELVSALPEIITAQCFMVSSIGQSIREPQVLELRLQLQADSQLPAIESRIREITHAHLDRIETIQEQLIEAAIKVY